MAFTIPAATQNTEAGRTAVRSIVLCSALLLILLRLLAPFQVGHDQATQIEAAHRFVSGLGVTTTNVVSNYPDIAMAPKAATVTWWPPGFSVVLAGLLAVGLPLVVALKLLFASTTLAGWYGWAQVGDRFLVPIQIGGRRLPIHLIVAVFMPLMLTPRWSRSDLLLWAGVPFLLILLARPNAKGVWRQDLAAGCLIGALIGFRYAAVFLVPAAVLMLLQYSWPAWRAIVRRGVVLGPGILIFVLPLGWFLYTAAETGDGEVMPGITALGGDEIAQASFLTAVHWVMEQTPAAWYVFPGLSAIGSAALKQQSIAIRYAVGCVALLVIFSLPLLARKVTHRPLAISLSFLPGSLILVLAYANKGLFFSVARYYDPVVIAAVFLTFAVAASDIVRPSIRLIASAAAIVSTSYLLLFIPFSIAWSPERRDMATELVLGFSPARQAEQFSSSALISFPDPAELVIPKQATRLRMFDLHRANPDALWFVQYYALFAYDAALQPSAPKPGVEMRVFPRSSYWKAAFTSRSVRMFFVLHDKSDIPFIPEGSRKQVYENSSEQSRIVMVDVPAGYAFKASGEPGETPAAAGE